jgi:hypothetical protein
MTPHGKAPDMDHVTCGMDVHHRSVQHPTRLCLFQREARSSPPLAPLFRVLPLLYHHSPGSCHVGHWETQTYPGTTSSPRSPHPTPPHTHTGTQPSARRRTIHL